MPEEITGRLIRDLIRVNAFDSCCKTIKPWTFLLYQGNISYDDINPQWVHRVMSRPGSAPGLYSELQGGEEACGAQSDREAAREHPVHGDDRGSSRPRRRGRQGAKGHPMTLDYIWHF